jgi:hypothetical protein
LYIHLQEDHAVYCDKDQQVSHAGSDGKLAFMLGLLCDVSTRVSHNEYDSNNDDRDPPSGTNSPLPAILQAASCHQQNSSHKRKQDFVLQLHGHGWLFVPNAQQ